MSVTIIDIDFFLKTWPEQGIKMTLSEYSLENLADNIIFLHELGFKDIGGVNLFEGEFDWSSEKYMIRCHLIAIFTPGGGPDMKNDGTVCQTCKPIAADSVEIASNF